MNGRRHFLKTIAFAIPTTAAGVTLVEQRGGFLNALETPSDEEIKRVHDSIEQSPFFGESAKGLVDVHAHALYDVLRIAPNVETPLRFDYFSNPIGASRFNRFGQYRDADEQFVENGAPEQWCQSTLADTNMFCSNRLPPPQAQMVESILFIFNPSARPEDIDAFARNYYFELKLGDKIFSRAPLVRCSAAGDLAALLDCDHAGIPTSASRARNSAPIETHLAIRMKKPLYIPPMMHFTLGLFGTPFKTAGEIALFAFLDGVGMFPIQ